MGRVDGWHIDLLFSGSVQSAASKHGQTDKQAARATGNTARIALDTAATARAAVATAAGAVAVTFRCPIYCVCERALLALKTNLSRIAAQALRKHTL